MKAFILGARSLRYPVGLAFISFWGWVEGARGQNLVHLQKVVFLCQSFLEVNTGISTTYQKTFILRSYVQHRVSFYSMTLDSRVHARGEGQGLAVKI